MKVGLYIKDGVIQDISYDTPEAYDIVVEVEKRIPWHTDDFPPIPKFKWNGKKIIDRPIEEIETERKAREKENKVYTAEEVDTIVVGLENRIKALESIQKKR